MFRNPLRQPSIVPTNSAEESLQKLLDGQVTAAIVPTPLVNLALQEGKDLVVVKTSVPGDRVFVDGELRGRTPLDPLQVSAPLQKRPSSQGAVLLAFTHPVAGLHESSVHTLLSSQLLSIDVFLQTALKAPQVS